MGNIWYGMALLYCCNQYCIWWNSHYLLFRYLLRFHKFPFRCCKMHDWCYSTSSCKGLAWHLPYFVPFKWKCNGGAPYCSKLMIFPNNSKCNSRARPHHPSIIKTSTLIDRFSTFALIIYERPNCIFFAIE